MFEKYTVYNTVIAASIFSFEYYQLKKKVLSHSINKKSENIGLTRWHQETKYINKLDHH